MQKAILAACALVALVSTARAQVDGGVPIDDAATDAGPERQLEPDASPPASDVEPDGGVAPAPEPPPSEPEPEDEEEHGASLADLMGEEEEELGIPGVVVRARAAPPERVETGGSVQRIDAEALQRFSYANPEAVLQQFAPVYVRQEDGFGLRPNIGLRGTNPDRSSRITLMEDGVLFGPAPYSAPAAYYFPLMQRFVGTDVYTGSAVLPYGPFSVGGAIDFRTRDLPREPSGAVDLAAGSYYSGRLHLHYGASNEWGGFLVEGVYLRSDGFKHLDFAARDGGTGFDRGDLVVRGDLHGSPMNGVYHRLELRFGVGLEGSNESYLGLTDADFRADPYRRYGATALDRMEWWRTQAQLRYRIELGDDVEITTVAYRHDLSRAWNKVNGLEGADLFQLLLNPSSPANQVYYRLLTGLEPQDPGAPLPIFIGTNARGFISEGIQSDASIRFSTGDFAHRLRLGLRLHYDEIVRDHTEGGYIVEGEQLIQVREVRPLLQNRASATALSAYAAWGVTWQTLSLIPAIRSETIWTDYSETYPGPREQSQLRASFLPGVSLAWQAIPELRIFGGVHRGFAPVAPGQPQEVQPEDAVQYEVGASLDVPSTRTRAQATLFISDYSSFLVQCSFGEGCGATSGDEQANAGHVLIGGLESSITERLTYGDFTFPLRAVYTFTYTSMLTPFESTNPQYGNVQVGDHLPYVPEHQLALQAGAEMAGSIPWGANLAGSFVGEMWEQAGQGTPNAVLGETITDAYFLLDASAYVEPLPHVRFYLRAENLTFTQAIVARRPFGARPNRPFVVQLGLRIEL